MNSSAFGRSGFTFSNRFAAGVCLNKAVSHNDASKCPISARWYNACIALVRHLVIVLLYSAIKKT